MNERTHIDLFSGIGGFSLAAESCGLRTVVHVEIDKFCQRVLRHHWPDVPIVEDIRDFDGKKYRGATLLTGGFPCQPYSQAGRRRPEDDRILWPEMFRAVQESRPDWVLGENVASSGAGRTGYRMCAEDRRDGQGMAHEMNDQQETNL